MFDHVFDRLKPHAEAGFTSFDTADIYGPSEGEKLASDTQFPEVSLKNVFSSQRLLSCTDLPHPETPVKAYKVASIS